MNNSNKNIAIILAIVIAAGILLWGTNIWVESKLRSLLDEKVSEGQLNYESLSANIITNRASIRLPHWVDAKETTKIREIKAQQLIISNFSYFQYFLHGSFKIGSINVVKPDITIYPAPPDTLKSEKNPADKKSLKDILIKNLKVEHGTVQYFRQDTNQQTLFCQFPELEVENIKMDSNTVHRSIPLEYGNYSVSGDSFIYRMSELYDLEINRFNTENGRMNLDSLQIIPRYDKFEFQSHVPFQKTWVDLCIPQTKFINAGWKLNKDSMEFSATRVELSSADLNLYKDNRLDEYPYIKPMYSKLIRELPVKLDIDTVQVIDAAVNFQLRTRKEPPPGIVYFNQINGTIAQLTNVGMDQPDFPQTTVSANSRFMKEANIHLDWRFDIDSQADQFQVSGTLSRISQQGINYFITPALNVSAEGAIDQLAFNFAGNDKIATGDMYINYDDLQIYLLKKDGTKRSQWISSILNFFLQNKLDGPIEKKDIKVERNQKKSFWNYLWEMVKKGTLESIT